MQNRAKIWNTAKVAMATAAVAGFLAFSSTPVRADDCQSRTEKIDHNLHDAIAHHGPDRPPGGPKTIRDAAANIARYPSNCVHCVFSLRITTVSSRFPSA